MTDKTIRLANVSDAAAMIAWYGPLIASTAISFETEPLTLHALEERLRAIQAKYPWIVCEIEGELAGFSYAGPHRARPGYAWTVETAIYVAEPFRRRRVGRALYRTLMALLAVQGYQSAYASITVPNDASIALHRSFGFEPVGVYRNAGFKLGKWHDASWWQIQIRETPPEQPERPLTPEEASESPEWTAAMKAGLEDLASR